MSRRTAAARLDTHLDRSDPMPARTVVRVFAFVAFAFAPRSAAAQAAESQAPVKQVVIPTGVTPSPNFSPGVRSRNVLYVAGQLPAANAGADIQSQTRSALSAVKTIVEAGGTTMANVAKCTVFLTSAADFAGMNEAYVTFFPKDPPARSTVVVAALVRADAKVEIECIAALPR
jgi:2-iminobutanoate/2-iminopropanoate deaminase